MATPRLSPNELQQMLANRDTAITVIDVRSQERFDAGHVPGALHIPVDEIKARLPEIPKDHLLVTY